METSRWALVSCVRAEVRLGPAIQRANEFITFSGCVRASLNSKA